MNLPTLNRKQIRDKLSDPNRKIIISPYIIPYPQVKAVYLILIVYESLRSIRSDPSIYSVWSSPCWSIEPSLGDFRIMQSWRFMRCCGKINIISRNFLIRNMISIFLNFLHEVFHNVPVRYVQRLTEHTKAMYKSFVVYLRGIAISCKNVMIHSFVINL